MEKEQLTTLHVKRNLSTKVYPNVKDANIPDSIQRKLTSGTGISIENNVVSCTIDASKFLTTDILENNIDFGKNVTIDGTLQLNNKNDITFVEGGTLVTTEELQADYNALDSKIEANSAIIDTINNYKISEDTINGVITISEVK